MRCRDLHLQIQDIFDLMQIQTSSTFEQFLQAETLNAKKNKSYYQRYNVKLLRAFHMQAMIKQQIYNNMLARRSGMNYSQGIQFQKSIVNMEEAKGLTINNQQKHCKCGSIKHLRISSKNCPVGLAIRKAKNRPWRQPHLNWKQRRQQQIQQQRKRENV